MHSGQAKIQRQIAKEKFHCNYYSIEKVVLLTPIDVGQALNYVCFVLYIITFI